MSYEYDEIDRLIDDLTKPTYVLRMARALIWPRPTYSTNAHKSAATRARNAKTEIRKALAKYAERVTFE